MFARSALHLRRAASLLAAVVALAVPASALAQSAVYQRCVAMVTPVTAIRFDNSEHRAWYLRFWTGSCAGTHSFCMSGSPDWNTTIDYVLNHAPAPQRAALVDRACRLGQTIGLEWARDKHIKRITLQDLRAFEAILNQTPDLSAALTRISQRVSVLMSVERSGTG